MNDITAVYKEITAKAEMQIEGLVKVMPSGYIQIWQIMLTNVGEVPLKKNKLKASKWLVTRSSSANPSHDSCWI